MVEIKDLYVEGEDFFFDGNLRLLGNAIIKNGSLTVTGNLVLAETNDHSGELISPTLEITNGNLTAGNLWTETMDGEIADDKRICEKFSVDGDIHITNGNLDIAGTDIEETGDIIVEGDLSCNNIITALSVYVSECIYCYDINTILDIYCGNFAEVNGDTNCGGNLYSESYYDCNGNDILVKGSLTTNGLYNASSIKVG